MDPIINGIKDGWIPGMVTVVESINQNSKLKLDKTKLIHLYLSIKSILSWIIN